jgi:hypothetical protein
LLAVAYSLSHPLHAAYLPQAEESAAKLEKWQKDGTMRTARSSKFQAPGADGDGGGSSGSGEGASNATPSPAPPPSGPHAV